MLKFIRPCCHTTQQFASLTFPRFIQALRFLANARHVARERQCGLSCRNAHKVCARTCRYDAVGKRHGFASEESTRLGILLERNLFRCKAARDALESLNCRVGAWFDQAAKVPTRGSNGQLLVSIRGEPALWRHPFHWALALNCRSSSARGVRVWHAELFMQRAERWQCSNTGTGREGHQHDVHARVARLPLRCFVFALCAHIDSLTAAATTIQAIYRATKARRAIGLHASQFICRWLDEASEAYFYLNVLTGRRTWAKPVRATPPAAA